MLSSLYSGISGLLTNSETINVVGNNIANVNTVGYKSQSTAFQDMLYQSIQSASGTSQVGRGAILATVSTSFSQGSFETTTSATDLAIGGNGFFIVKGQNSDTNYYTRAGGFSFDADGNLTNSAGLILQGKVIDRTTDTAYGVDTDINVSSQPSEPKATTKVGMVVNLQSDAAWAGTFNNLTTGEVTALAASSGTYPATGTYSITTTLGANHTGSSAVTFGTGLAGSVTINGTAIDVTGVTTMAGLLTAINGQTATTGVTAVNNGGSLQLTTATAKDVVVSTSGITSGDLGWSATDIASDQCLGIGLAMSSGTSSYTDRVSAGTTSVTNMGGSGIDLTLGSPAAAGTQTFTAAGFDLANSDTTSNYSSSVTVYDSLGQSHVLNVYFTKVSTTSTPPTSSWQWNAVLDANDSKTQVDTIVATGNLTFNDSGVLISGGDPVGISCNFAGGSAQGQPINLVFGPGSGGGSTTSYPMSSTTDFQTQDGYAPGTLTSISVSTGGVISGTYSNGQIIDLYQITLASFNNPQGLTREGGNLYSETLESGVPYTKAPGEGGLGNINSNSLEQSNVDLATEFVKMIVAQRGYQASSKVITTTDEMLQELMQIKR